MLAAICIFTVTGCGVLEGEKDTAGERQNEVSQTDENLTSREDADEEGGNGVPGGQERSQAPRISISQEAFNRNADDSGKNSLYVAYNVAAVSGEGFGALAEGVSQWSAQRVREFESKADYYIQESLVEEQYSTIDQSLKIARADSHVVSLIETVSEYMGGAHENYGIGGVTFDGESGKLLELSDILNGDEGFYRAAEDGIINSLRENYGDSLFPGFEDTVKQMWDNNPQWYLDGAGITFLFNPYEVGPYAMGVAYVTLPYGEYVAYMQEKFVLWDSAGVWKVPEGSEVSLSQPSSESGSEKETLRVYIEKEGENEDGSVYVEISGHSEEVDAFGRIGDIYLVKREDGRTFVLLDADYASDDFVTFVYEITGGTIQERERLEGANLWPGAVNTDGVTLRMHLDVLGTYSGQMDYKLGEDGQLVQEEEFFQIPYNESLYRILTTVRELPVTVDGSKTSLPVGTRLRITATDNKGTAIFTVEEGNGMEGEIHYTRGDGKEDTWTIYIDGLPDTDYFELVPYAG